MSWAKVSDVTRLEGLVRTSGEMRFYLELHPCPACGNRDLDLLADVTTRGAYRMPDPRSGEMRDAGHDDVTCSRCGHVRRVQFFEAKGYPQVRISDCMGDDEVSRVKSSHLGGPDPSQIISPNEFAAVLANAIGHVTGEFASLDGDAFGAERHQIRKAMTCAIELLKFIPPGAEEIPAEHLRADEARKVRADHPDYFCRTFLAEQLARFTALDMAAEAEMHRRSEPLDERAIEAKAAQIVRDIRTASRSATPAIVAAHGPFSQAAIAAHELWLSDHGGQRLRAIGVDVTGQRLSALDLTAAIFDDVTLDRADLSFTRFHGAHLTNVRARGAGFASAMIAGTTLKHCDFTGSGMPIANLGDATIDDCDFSGANLERTTWYRSKVSRCNFAGSAITDAGLDKAVFTDCDFRGADLGIVKVGLLGTAMDAEFIRCDLRDTHWQGRDLFRVRFIDCKLAGSHGTPKPDQTVIERPDLSPAGDGSQIGTDRDVQRLWGIDPDVRVPSPSTEAARG